MGNQELNLGESQKQWFLVLLLGALLVLRHTQNIFKHVAELKTSSSSRHMTGSHR